MFDGANHKPAPHSRAKIADRAEEAGRGDRDHRLLHAQFAQQSGGRRAPINRMRIAKALPQGFTRNRVDERPRALERRLQSSGKEESPPLSRAAALAAGQEAAGERRCFRIYGRPDKN